jgi:NAD-dependent SIR2 family protein deacetylase
VRAHGTIKLFRCENAGAGAEAAACAAPDESLDLWSFAVNADAGGERKASSCLPPKLERVPLCEQCGSGRMRPACVMFDEEYDPDVWSTCEQWIRECAALAFVGSSNAVSLTRYALRTAATRKLPVFNFNLSKASCASYKSELYHVIGPAEATLPELHAKTSTGSLNSDEVLGYAL